MIRYPFVSRISKQKQYTVQFGGINMTEHNSEGEFSSTKNLSADRYPIVSGRPSRVQARTLLSIDESSLSVYAGARVIDLCSRNGIVTTIEAPADEIGRYQLFWEYVEDGAIKSGAILLSNEKPKSIVPITDSIVIFPEGVILSVGENRGTEKIEKTYTLTAGTNSLKIGTFKKTQDGTEEIYGIGSTDSISDFPFKGGDTVKISGSVSEKNKKYATIRGEIETGWSEGVSWYVIPFDFNIFEEEYSSSVELIRDVPELEFAVEWNNRIWGIEGDTVYASALGDPKNFRRYDGTATDSWALSIGSSGKFTGMAAFGNQLLLFKENMIHRIYGTTPATFQLSTLNAPGVQDGSEKSICDMRSLLFYKAPDGVYAYDGQYSRKISEKLTGLYSDAVAGTDGERYYISMKDPSDKWGLYVYNAVYDTWLREDDTQVLAFAYYDNVLFYVDPKNNEIAVPSDDTKYHFIFSAIYRGHDSPYLSTPIEEDVYEWSAELCPINEVTKEKKSYSRLWLRAELSSQSYISVEYSCDGGPFMRAASEAYNERSPVIDIPIRPDRCDSFRIRLSGKGRVNLRAIVREVSV